MIRDATTDILSIGRQLRVYDVWASEEVVILDVLIKLKESSNTCNTKVRECRCIEHVAGVYILKEFFHI